MLKVMIGFTVSLMGHVDRINKRINKYLRARMEMIKPEPTLGLFNFRCFDNAVEYQRRYPEMEVIEVIYIEHEYPILHYINRDPVDGSYRETTLGWQAPHLEYYFIRKIHPQDYPYIKTEFERSLEHWLEEYTNWFQRHILRIKRIL